MAKFLLKTSALINLVVTALAFCGMFCLYGMLELLNEWELGVDLLQVVMGIIASYTIVIFIAGILFLNYSKLDEDTLTTKKTPILIWSIVLIVFNFVAGVLAIIAFSEIGRPKPEMLEKKKLDAETKKLIILLNLGTILIGIAGIMFSTSSWNVIDDIVKVVGLLIFTAIFWGVSILADKKFNLTNSSTAYYILANLFLIVTLVCAGYFEIFGNWFSIYGEGSGLFMMTIFLLVAGLSVLALGRYKVKPILYITGVSILAAAISVMVQFDMTIDIIKIVVGVLLLVLVIVNTKLYNSNKFANNMLGIVLAIFTLITFSTLENDQNIWLNIISGVLLIGIFYYMLIFNNNQKYDIFTPAVTVILTGMLGSICREKFSLDFVEVASIILILNLLVYLSSYLKIGDGTYRATAFGISLVSIANLWILGIMEEAYGYALVVALILCVLNLLVLALKKDEQGYKAETYLQPVKIFLIIISATIFIVDKLDAATSIWMIITSLIFIAIHFLNNNKIMKNIYLISAVTFTILYMLYLTGGEYGQESIIWGALTVLNAVIIFIAVYRLESGYKDIAKRFAFLLMIIVAFESILGVMANNEMLTGGVLITLILACLTAFLFINDRYIFGTSLLSLIYAYFILTNNIIEIDTNLMFIFNATPLVLGVFVITRILLGKLSNNLKNILEIIALVFVYGPYIFGLNTSVTTLSIGISALIFIIIGFRNKKIYSLFYVGIIVLIFNIIAVLKDFWNSVPLWGYVLLAGAILVGIVTYKEYKKNKPEIEEVKEKTSDKTETKSISTISADAIIFTILAIIVLTASYEEVSSVVGSIENRSHNSMTDINLKY